MMMIMIYAKHIWDFGDCVSPVRIHVNTDEGRIAKRSARMQREADTVGS